MQEKDKKEQKRRTWRGFTSADGTDYAVFLLGDRVQLVAKEEVPGEDDEVHEIEMSLEDFKQFLAMAQEMLGASDGGDVLRDTGTARR